jgi:hypothetical protein
MDQKSQDELKQRYMVAIQSFVGKVKDDPGVIAVIVSGSVAYDVVWEKSDIDMTVIVRDQLLKNENYCIVEDGITINVFLMIRSAFKRTIEGSIGGSWFQSYLSNGKIVYSSDESLAEYFEEIKNIGSDDRALSMFTMAGELIGLYDKVKKWLEVRKDPVYAQYFLLKAAEPIARMEMCMAGMPFSRNSIQKVLQMNPDVINPFYRDAMTHLLSEEEILSGLEKIDAYLEKHLEIIKKPVITLMADQEIKTITVLSRYFRLEPHYIVEMFEFLVEKGVLEKVSQIIRITARGKKAVEEIGYLYIP